ncbi:MAG TPA: hypothetical protein VN181_04030, partial [Thermoanaerobaculia bacterium]|nr:hypothetical protein [Thermoanaerobaculia bacterium]
MTRARAVAVALFVIIGGVFFSRFVAARIVFERLVPAAAAALLVVAASIGFGAIAIALARSGVRRRQSPLSVPDQERQLALPHSGTDVADEFLVGVSVFGSVLSLIALAILNPLIVYALTLIAATYGALARWRRVVALVQTLRPSMLLLPPIAIAFIGAISPVNTPDELVYKLALPKMYLLFGRMLELPLNSQSYFPSSVYMADLAALVLSGGIAAKLVHFVIYLVVLRVIRRASSTWATAVIAWTPALALIAGWAWAEWAMIGFVLLSFISWQEQDLALAACALGAALATKYTALPWLLLFLPIAIWRLRAWQPLAKAALTVIAVGGLFYVRNVVWTGSPIAPFLLPESPDIVQYRSTAGGFAELIRGYDIFHEGIIDDSLGILLPVMVLLSPFALIGRDRRAVELFLIGAAQLAMLIPLAPTSRLMALALVPL